MTVMDADESEKMKAYLNLFSEEGAIVEPLDFENGTLSRRVS
jgi:hypothetical protein